MRDARIALRSLLEREPEIADTVTTICASMLYMHAPVISPDLIEDFSRLGLEAELMRADDDPMRWVEHVVLQLALARALNLRGNRFEALRTLHAIELPAADPLASARLRYLRASVESEEAAIREAGLERSQAQALATSVVTACDWLMIRENLGELVPQLAGLLDGESPPTEALFRAVLQMVWRDLSPMEVENAVRLARCAILRGDPGAANIERMLERIASRGVGQLTGIDFIPLLRGAPEALCRTILEKVPATAAAVHLDRTEFDQLLAAAAAAYSDIPDSFRRECIDNARALEDADDPLVRVIGLGLLVVAEGREEEPEHTEAFLAALDQFVESGSDAGNDWRIRAELDEPIGVLVKSSVRRLQSNELADRVRLARLLDSFRVSPPAALAWLLFPIPDAWPLLLDAHTLVDDLLGRLVFALQRQPKSVAIVIQATPEETLFLCVTHAGIEVFGSGSAFRDAAAAATAIAAEQVALLASLGVPPDDDAVLAAGRALFDAVPAGVRERIAKSDVVYVCPDYRASTDSVPFELMHDGANWCGLEKVVARVPSLETLVRTAEESGRRVLHRRLLSIGVTTPEGRVPLPAARAEIEMVRGRLADDGWDAPVVNESQVDPDFILQRTPFAAHLHIAAHGEADGGEESVILARGTRLTPADVLDGAFGCTPTVWLNTCVLGQATYLGAGVVRGVAQAFVQTGAPAVIANLLAVDDQVSARLAERFYTHANDHDFGESLRLARRDLAAEGVSPLLWGSTVLIGDAAMTLTPREVERPAWLEHLGIAVVERAEPEKLAGHIVGVMNESWHDAISDPRRLAAVHVVRALHAASLAGEQDDPQLLAVVCRICIRAHALDAAALAAMAMAEVTKADPYAAAITNGALALLRPLEASDPAWRQLTDRLLVQSEQLSRGDRALRTNVHVPDGTDAAEVGELRQMGDAVMGIRLAIDARNRWSGLSPLPRSAERTVDDVLWNAVLAQRTKTFEDMPETFAYARQTALKVARLGALPRELVPFAATMFAGLLKWMWDRHNLVALEREIAESHTRILQIALSSVIAHWSVFEPWMEPLLRYPEEIARRLGALDSMPYDQTLYTEMERAADGIRDDGMLRLEQVQSTDPARLPDAITYVMGKLVEKNTYSSLAGSVPESICEKLTAVHHALSMQAESYLMPWLMEGFSAAGEATIDHLQRWTFEMPVHPGE